MALPQNTYQADGSVDIVDTDYTIPGGAYYLATDGDDGANGTSTGTAWATLSHAVSTAPSGSTIVVRGGTYRQGGVTFNKGLTIQPYPHEKVWFKGSVVTTGWVVDGSNWRLDNWTIEYAVDVDPNSINPSYPLAAYRDMVFIDGAPLTQVASLGAVGVGKFYSDYTNNRIYIGSDPTGKTVEVAAQAYCLYLNGSSGANSVIRGLGFMHYATYYRNGPRGAVQVEGSGPVTIEDNTSVWNAVGGIGIFNGAGMVVRRNTLAFNGEIGIPGWNVDNALIEENVFAYNNQEHFEVNWDAAGLKITGSDGVTLSKNLTDSNLCHGLWLDLYCTNAKIVNNVGRNDSILSIHYELCSYAIIASNLVVGNLDCGIYVGAGSDHVQVYNNTLVNCKRGIAAMDDNRPENLSVITIRNNIISNAPGGTDLFSCWDSTSPVKTAETMGVTMDYDAYYRTSSSSPTVLTRWQGSSSLLAYNTLAAFNSATGQEANGISIDNVATNPFFVDVAAGDYRIKLGSVAKNAGVALPQDVADAIGVTAGVPVDLGAFNLAAPVGGGLPQNTYQADGTVDIVDTNYEIAGTVRYVSNGGNNGSNGLTTGTAWQTLAYAITNAPSGATIVIRGGTYREGDFTISGKSLIFQAYPHEKVWLKGSNVVSSWTPSGSTWYATWTIEWTNDFPAEDVDGSYPMAPYRDMVFIDGVAQTQVASQGAVSAGEFYSDYGNNRVYIGTDPAGKTVEVAARAQAIRFSGSGANNSKVRGLGVVHYATGGNWSTHGALWSNVSSGVVFEDNTVAWCASAGISPYDAPNNTVRRNTLVFNGKNGLTGNNCSGLLVEENIFAYNNIEHFTEDWSSGGSKLVRVTNHIFRDNLSDHNYANGLWWDIDCNTCTIIRNTSLNDHRAGLEYEISQGPTIIASNLVVNSNTYGGIKIGAGSSNIKLYNNTIVGCQQGIMVTDDNRGTYTPANIEIRNNILSNALSGYHLFTAADSTSPPASADGWTLTLDYDAYYRTSSSTPSVLARWQSTGSLLTYNTLAAFRSAEGQETNGISIDNVATNPFFVDAAGGDYRLKSDSVAKGAGTPLPSDVATALGLTAGVPVDLGALHLGAATPTPNSDGIAINAGGTASGTFVADAYFSGGTAYTNSHPSFDTSGVTNPPPTIVYQTERYGNFTYTITGLTADASYTVRLHFVEVFVTAVGQRLFDVAINGSPVLSSFDLFAVAGGQDIAVVRQFTVSATASGEIAIQFTSVVQNAKICGIEIIAEEAAVVIVSSVGSSMSAATGRPGQSHLVYGVNNAKWYLFYLSGTNTLSVRGSSDYSTWSDINNQAGGTTLTLLNPHLSEGRNFGFYYASLGGADVVHMTSGYMLHPSDYTYTSAHARFTLGATAFTVANAETAYSTTGNTGATPVSYCGPATALDSGGHAHDLSPYEVSVGYGNFSLADWPGVDSGGAWTPGTVTLSQAYSAPQTVTSGFMFPVGTGVLALADDGSTTGNFTQVKYSLNSAGTWPAAGDVLAATVTSTSADNYSAVKVSNTDVHVVALSNNSNTFVHRRFNGSTWSDGQSIPNLTLAPDSGILLATDGTDVYLSAIEATTYAIKRLKWTAATPAWAASWTLVDAGSASARSYLSGYNSVVSGNIGLIWTEVNGANYDINAIQHSISAAPTRPFRHVSLSGLVPVDPLE